MNCRVTHILGSIVVLLIFSINTPGFAGVSETKQCFDGLTAVKFAVQGIPDKNFVYTFFINEKAYYYLILAPFDENKKLDNGDFDMPWRLLQRDGDIRWCLIGAGSTTERLHSIQGFPDSGKRFGLPGSGYKRCNDKSDGITGSLDVRIWANKELGKSYIHSLPSEIGDTNFIVLNTLEPVNAKLPWIILSAKILKTKKGNIISCYLGRGDNFKIDLNLKISPKLNMEVPRIEGLQR